MDELYEQTLLFDFYGELLTKKQREICRLHWQEDWSLGEISEELGISRQGVYDTLKRALSSLQNTEDKLHMAERFLSISRQVSRLESLLGAGAAQNEVIEQLQGLKEAIKIRS